MPETPVTPERELGAIRELDDVRAQLTEDALDAHRSHGRGSGESIDTPG
jgi:hypothetical protein